MADNTVKSKDDELAHINEEMYKKNLELNERNKMLALLRKIDHIILGSLTKVDQIADQVTHEIIKSSKIRSIFIYFMDHKNNVLYPLSIAFSEEPPTVSDDVLHIYYNEKISLNEESHPLIESIRSKKIINEKKMSRLFSQLDSDEVDKIQRQINIKEYLIYPFFIRKESAGAIVFGLGEAEFTFEYWKDFIFRLPEVISIAINNAILYQQIEESNDKLRELDKLKDEFVSVASHELRTPITAIKNYLWLAMSKGKISDEETKNYLNIGYSSSERLLNLVEDMLTVSRIEGKRLVLQMESVNLNDLVKSVFDEFSVNATERKIKLKMDLGEKIRFTKGDKEKLREVIQNILGNAIKFTSDQGEVNIIVSEKGSFQTIEVFNTGSFIDPDDKNKLFEKFRRIETKQSDKAPVKGTGLGLYISKQLIELHNGRIDVMSEKNEGTAFIISLPKAEVNEK
ncbi:HAMP domain-containing histidine kinase [Candidatus Roizmanbacteria bacterium]|nr:HAMP domain-containing histidine kinase [Candidatus Roizmanbacteria bacterium]